MVKPDRVAVVRAGGHQLCSRKAAAVGVQVVLAAHDAHAAGQRDGGVLQNADTRCGKGALQVGAAKTRLPPVVKQVVVAQHIVFAQGGIDLAEELAEGVEILFLGVLVEDVAGQHQQIRLAGRNFLPQFRDAGAVHGRAGPGVYVADLYDAQLTIGQGFLRCQVIFCGTQPQRPAAAPPHDKPGQQPRHYAAQPKNMPNSQRRTADTPQHQPDAGADAVEGDEMPDKDDAKAQRVPADISQQRHQHQRQAVVQHRPLGHKLQRRQL